MKLRETFARPLRLGLIGGGPDSWIGAMHRGAATMDGWFDLTAGVFSSDAARSRAAGAALGLDAARSYGDLAEMLRAEAARDDPIDAVAIMTPNDMHHGYAAAALDAGLDVISDKPVSETFAQACDLLRRTRERSRLFAIVHGYSAYPMTRYARRLVHEGALGAIRLVQVEYIQSGMATRVEDGAQTNRLRWVLDPSRSGLALVMSAIGCHAHHLACHVTGAAVTRVVADVSTLLPQRQLIDHVSALLEFDNGARGNFTVTQAAAGGENDIRLRVYGEKGMLDWSHRSASYLTIAMQGEPARTVGRGDAFLPPEGLREAFANIYAELAQDRMARAMGQTPPALPYPRIEEGAHTMAFIEACLASHAAGRWEDVAPLPGR